MLRQQLKAGGTVDDVVRLGGGKRHLIMRLRRIRRPQLVGPGEDIGDAGRFQQHAPFRGDNQNGFHVLKNTRYTN